MTQTLIIVVLFVAAMTALPWMVRRVQARQAAGGAPGSVSSRVIGAVAVGPQQRVVTVEVGPEGARTWLVLGVTAQSIHCLHVLNSGAVAPVSTVASFAGEMAQASQASDKVSHA